MFVHLSEMGRFWRNLFSCFSKQPEVNQVVATNRDTGVPTSRNEATASNVASRQAELSAGSNQNQARNPLVSPQKVENVSDPRYVSLNNTVIAFIDNQSSDSIAILNGTFGKRKVLIKRIPKRLNQAALNEVKLVTKIDSHETVIRFLCIVEDSKHTYIVTDKHQVSLRKYVNGLMGPPMNQEVFKQLTNAADYLHRMNIIYFNFNPDDVHVVNRNEILRIKLTNFSYSEELPGNFSVYVDSEFKGIDGFIAPEILKQRIATHSSDIYSLGCLFYFMVSRGQILRPQSQMIIDRKLLTHLKASMQTCDRILFFNIMTKCLKMLPMDRMSAKAIKEDPYFWSVHETFDLILEVTKALENGHKKLQNKLQFNKNKILGADWKTRIGEEVTNELSKTRQYDGQQLFQLVQVIRNHYVHKSLSPVLDSIIGTTKEEVMSYWMERFPLLIPHLYDVMRT